MPNNIKQNMYLEYIILGVISISAIGGALFFFSDKINSYNAKKEEGTPKEKQRLIQYDSRIRNRINHNFPNNLEEVTIDVIDEGSQKENEEESNKENEKNNKENEEESNKENEEESNKENEFNWLLVDDEESQILSSF